jgi:hypothetical protein
MAGDVLLQVNCTFKTFVFDGLATILESGITGVIWPLLAMAVQYGKLSATLGFNRLEISQVPFNTPVIIQIFRRNGICSMFVDRKILVSMACANTALFPAPSDNNIWSIIGVGVQKDAANSVARQINTFSSTVGYIHAIKMIGGNHAVSLVYFGAILPYID